MPLHNDFCVPMTQTREVEIRDRSEFSGTSLLKADFISTDEIKLARQVSEIDNGKLNDKELVKSIASMFGFKRVGSDLNRRILECLRDETP